MKMDTYRQKVQRVAAQVALAGPGEIVRVPDDILREDVEAMLRQGRPDWWWRLTAEHADACRRLERLGGVLHSQDVMGFTPRMRESMKGQFDALNAYIDRMAERIMLALEEFGDADQDEE